MNLELIRVELQHEHFFNDEFWQLSKTLCYVLLKKPDKMWKNSLKSSQTRSSQIRTKETGQYFLMFRLFLL